MAFAPFLRDAVYAQDRAALAESTHLAQLNTREVAQLSFRGVDVAPDALARVFALPRNGWAVSSNVARGTLSLFNAQGLPTSTLGRLGSGPGEFRGQVLGVTVGDRLWIADSRSGRLSIFSRDMKLIHSRPLPGRVFSVSRGADTTTLTLSGFFNRPGGPQTLARVGFDPDRDAFGGTLASNPNPKVQMRMAAHTGTEVWSVAVAGGAIDVFNAEDLALVDQLRLAGDMFERVDPVRTRDRNIPPAPEVSGLTAGEDGTLWIVIGAPDRNWSPSISPDDGADRWADTVILGIDPAVRTIVVRARLDDLCLPMSHGRVSCVDEMDERIRILELRR